MRALMDVNVLVALGAGDPFGSALPLSRGKSVDIPLAVWPHAPLLRARRKSSSSGEKLRNA